jgi:signal transduction histidine kinase
LEDSGFLGLVDSRRAALFPQRIFADLLPASPPAPLSANAPLEQAQRRLLDEGVCALPVVDRRGLLVGAVTRDSLLAVLRDRGQELSPKCEECSELGEQQHSLIAFEIHDGLMQYATAAQMHFQAIAAAQEPEDAVRTDQFARGMILLEETIREARSLIQGLYPPGLDSGGVATAIERLVDQRGSGTGPKIEFEHELGELRLSRPQEIAVYRVAQEALANAMRHSGSDRIRIALVQKEAHIRLTIRDWGRGFDPDTVPPRHGLSGIRRRASALQGRVTIESSPQQGTRIVVEFPVRQELSGGRDGV